MESVSLVDEGRYSLLIKRLVAGSDIVAVLVGLFVTV